MVVTFVKYTGIGADKSFLHTKKRFLHIMKKTKSFADLICTMVGDPVEHPETFDEWVEYSGGAVYRRKDLPEGYYYDNRFIILKGAGPPPPLECDACPICLEPMVARVKVRVLPCAHKGCVKCMDRWMRRSTSCPVCRTEVN